MPVRKIAIFVEGSTEVKFFDRYLREVTSQKNIDIEHWEVKGGRNGPRTTTLVKAKDRYTSARYYAMIVNSGTDNRVVSDVRDQYPTLIKAGYNAIIGIRDVYGTYNRTDIPKLRIENYTRIKTRPIKPPMLLAIMEIEAWFLAEHTHFRRVNRNLSMAKIIQHIGFDPENDDPTLRPHPSDDLDKIYSLVNCRYTKKATQIDRTVNALDFANIHLDLPERIDDLKLLSTKFNRFF